MTTLDPQSRVLRHVLKSQYTEGVVDGGAFRVDGNAFQLRERLADGTPERGLSVVNLDLIQGQLEQRLTQVRADFPKEVKASHRFAELSVEDAIANVRKKFADDASIDTIAALTLIHSPIPPSESKPGFDAHCEIFGLPLRTDILSAVVGEAISYAVRDLHPAIVVVD